MGVFSVEIDVGTDLGGQFEHLEARVDTGASYTTLPASMLERIGVRPIERREFVLASGEVRNYDIGQARVRLNGSELVCIVAFGDESAVPVVGAVTLQDMGLGVDTVVEKLIRVRNYML